MKPLLIALCLFAAAAGFAPANARSRRDVSEIVADKYLPPATESAPETTTAQEEQEEQEATPAATAALGENGYEYRTVRKLVFRNRNRRDVPHLNLEYLPPNNEYLPPAQEDAAVPMVTNEYLPPAEEAAETPKVSNEYLPPLPAVQQEQATEAAAIMTEAPVEQFQPEPEQDTAVLADDGYHYKRPEVVPDLAPAPVTREYLPPLEEGAVVAEGPEGETSVLAEDGYHYRAIKRIRF